MNKSVALILFIVCMVVGFICGFCSRDKSKPYIEVEKEVEITPITDTDVAPIDSVIVRRDTVYLPLVNVGNKRPPKTDNYISEEVVDSVVVPIPPGNKPDSVAVEIPISQYEFADSTYHLKVSGFHVSLDEITVFQRKEIITIKPPPKRWHIGVSVGYGYTPQGFQPVVAATLTYSLFSF